MRTCSKCKIEKPFEDYHRNKGRPHGREYICKKCRAIWSKERIDKLLAPVISAKLLGFCNKCGESHIATLVFHHRDPAEKKFNMSFGKGGIFFKNSEEEILAEMEKCIMLCENCHRILHYKERQKGA